ncbi:MAG: hypothetical protein ACHQ9S_27125 [Candidatus Binatia bacterium]
MAKERLATAQRKLKQRAFLRSLRRYRSVAMAAARAGTSRTEAYRWARKYPDFKEAFDDAIESMLDQVEKSLIDSATGVHVRPVVSGGRHVADERVFDTRAAELILRAYRNRYRERSTVEVMGGTTHEVKVTKEVTETLIASVTQILLDSGAYGDHETLALNAAASPPPAESALDDMRSAGP